MLRALRASLLDCPAGYAPVPARALGVRARPQVLQAERLRFGVAAGVIRAYRMSGQSCRYIGEEDTGAFVVRILDGEVNFFHELGRPAGVRRRERFL